MVIEVGVVLGVLDDRRHAGNVGAAEGGDQAGWPQEVAPGEGPQRGVDEVARADPRFQPRVWFIPALVK